MFAIISDIHGNIEALQAVLQAVDEAGITRIICLGDVVGYGPDAQACVSLIRSRAAITLKGNHDLALFLDPIGFNKAARDAVFWARRKLRPGFFSRREKRVNWHYLLSLPDRHEEGDYLFVHGSPRDPIMEYIEETDTLDVGLGISEKLRENFSLITGLCFIGHTHRPGIIPESGGFLKPAKMDDGWTWEGGKAIVNVGSVGQPRDGDPRACFVVVDENRVIYRRVPYNMEATAAKIRAISALDSRLADRLLEGR